MLGYGFESNGRYAAHKVVYIVIIIYYSIVIMYHLLLVAAKVGPEIKLWLNPNMRLYFYSIHRCQVISQTFNLISTVYLLVAIICYKNTSSKTYTKITSKWLLETSVHGAEKVSWYWWGVYSNVPYLYTNHKWILFYLHFFIIVSLFWWFDLLYYFVSIIMFYLYVLSLMLCLMLNK